MKLLNVREAAAALGVSAALIYGLCARRKIRHERHGLRRGRIRIPEDALQEYRSRVTVGAEPVPTPAPTKKKALLPSLDL